MSSTPYKPPAHRGLDILHLSDQVIVVNKPSGLLCVPGRGAGKEDSLSRRVQVELKGLGSTFQRSAAPPVLSAPFSSP
jgi:tRNA pseudouridine32 synthase/23S rRNA pseudouridine746 synthase